MPDKPTFVLLSQKLPADTLALKLLGRIVENKKQPTNGYRPENPRSLLTQSPIEVTDTNASIYRESVKDIVAQVQLGQLFGLSGQISNTDVAKLEGKNIITRLLLQHRDAFNKIYAKHKDEIDELLKLNSGMGYMVVGLKTVFDGQLEVQTSQVKSTEGEAKIPIATATTAATRGAVNLGETLDPKLRPK
jgi:hypothetical protein